MKHERIAGRLIDSEEYNASNKANDVPMNTEIQDTEKLATGVSKDILPYLSLDKLDDHEKASLFSLTDEILEIVKNGTPKDRFELMNAVEDSIADLAGEYDSWSEGRITPKTEQARKLFCASMLNAANSDSKLGWTIRDVFLACLPTSHRIVVA